MKKGDEAKSILMLIEILEQKQIIIKSDAILWYVKRYPGTIKIISKLILK